MFEAMGGLTHITGEPNGQPMHSGYPLADNIGGLFGAIGILAALYQRLQHPDAPGEEIDLALLESTLKILEFLPIEHEQLGVSRQRAGNTNQYSAPASVFCTKDQRWVSLSGSTDPLFCANCRAIEREDLITHPSYVNNSQRVQHSHALNAVFEAWFAQKTFDEALRTFEIHGGTLAPVYDMEQIAADPQIQARHSICDVTDSDFGSVRMSNVVPRFKYNPSTIQHSARDMGFDNLRFFSEELGLHVAEIAELQAEGVI